MSGNRVGAEARLVDPRYFQTMHIPLIAGRPLREDDSERVAVINRKMAHLLWPANDPIGREFTDNGGPPIRVIGIVGNVHSEPLETEPLMQYYSSFVVFPGYANSFAVRTKTDPLSLVPSMEKTIWNLDPDLAVSGVKPMEHIIQSATLERRFETDLLLGFSLSALFLSGLGLFGVASVSITRRSREFGIRMALGATGADVLWLAITRNVGIVLAALAIGLLLSLATHRGLTALLFDVFGAEPKCLRNVCDCADHFRVDRCAHSRMAGIGFGPGYCLARRIIRGCIILGALVLLRYPETGCGSCVWVCGRGSLFGLNVDGSPSRIPRYICPK